MAAAPEPSLQEQLWTVAVTRLLFGPRMSIQAPPNLQPEGLDKLVRAGINDWGGVSPVTPDHVNPEAPWPHLEDLARATHAAGRDLIERLALVPSYAAQPAAWTDPAITPRVRRMSDGRGFARPDRWYAGAGSALPPMARGSFHRDAPPATMPLNRRRAASGLSAIIRAARGGHTLIEADVVRLFGVEGCDFDEVIAAADQTPPRESVGDTVTYVVNRNINYTNICLYHCGFCAFSKGRGSQDLRGPAYNLDLDEVARRTAEAAAAGATEVCLQGGIHPSFTGDTYLNIVRAVKGAVPWMHVHAFSPLEVQHGAGTLGLPLAAYLERLRDAGLSTLPGTAAEILDDDIRDIICPDKLRTDEWLNVIGTAHAVGLRTTSTIMFGHVEQPVHWARHLLRLRALQERTGGITEFVPLGYVHMEAPLWRKGRTRSGPTFREALLMHAVPRLVLHPLIKNIQASWVKMGGEGAAVCLDAGANDLGGTLMNESITRAAGGVHGQELDARSFRRWRTASAARHVSAPRCMAFPARALRAAGCRRAGGSADRPRAVPGRTGRVGRGRLSCGGMMLRLGYKASAEQFGPKELLDFSVLAEQRGFDSVFISDHFQPWRHTGGHAPFSMAWMGALGARTSRIVMGTSVLTPTSPLPPLPWWHRPSALWGRCSRSA